MPGYPFQCILANKKRERDFVDQKTAAVNEQHEAVGNVGTTQPVEEESPDLTHTTASLKNKTISIVETELVGHREREKAMSSSKTPAECVQQKE